MNPTGPREEMHQNILQNVRMFPPYPPPFPPPPPPYQPWNTSVPPPPPGHIYPPHTISSHIPPFPYRAQYVNSEIPVPSIISGSHENTDPDKSQNSYKMMPENNYHSNQQENMLNTCHDVGDRISTNNSFTSLADAKTSTAKSSSFDQQRENDIEWTKEWLRHLNKTKLVSKCQTKCMHIGDVKTMMIEGLKILNELNEIHSQLYEGIHSGSEELWNYRQKRAIKLKGRIQEIQSQLQSNCNQIKHKMKRIRLKRNRIKRRKEREKQQHAANLQMREELHKQINAWQENIYEEDKRKEREKILKEEADMILSEVRKKQAESKKNLELIQALKKLRDLRKSAVEKKGLYTTKESDINFNSKISQMETMFQSQLNDYKAEEKALRVMLESSREAEEQQLNDQFNEHVLVAQEQLKQCLFGDTDPPPPSDPNFMLWNYHTQGESDINRLLQIRQEWDRYLVPENSSLGSSIPVSWVYPPKPSNENWALTLNKTSN